MWKLLQQDRAAVDHFGSNKSIYEMLKFMDELGIARAGEQAMLRLMALPAPEIVELVAKFLPYPNLWEVRIGMLTKRAVVDSNAAVSSCLDLIDEILEEGGFAEACDEAKVPVPTSGNFSSWKEWKAFGRCHGVAKSEVEENTARQSITESQIPRPSSAAPSVVEHRRHANFVQKLAKYESLAQVLTLPPYSMPPGIIQQLLTCSDAISLSRRMTTGVSFDAHVAIDFVMLISRLSTWYWCND